MLSCLDLSQFRDAELSGACQSPDLLQQILDALSAHLAILNEDGRIVAVNARWAQFAREQGGDPATTGAGADYLGVLERAAASGQDEAAEVLTGVQSVIRGDQTSFYAEYGCPTPTEHRWFAQRVTRCAMGGRRFLVVAHEDITQRRAAYERLRHAAFHDELTSLPNRKMLLEQLARCVARAQRAPETRFAVLFLDVDRFKVINDSMGHARGDELLAQVAERLRNGVRATDLVSRGEPMIARLGGDEFTVLLEAVNSHGDAEQVASRIHAAMAEPFVIGGRELFITVSIGISVHDASDLRETPEDYLRDADIAMYQAKASGHGRHQVFATPMREDAVNRLEVENDLRRALQAGQMVLHYQPLVSLQRRRITGFEALIRWNHPRRGLVGPADFIPLAEEIGMIVPIGRWVLATAGRQLAIWQRQFGHELVMAVNVSSAQLRQGGLVEAVDRVLVAGQLNPRCLNLEITESALLEPDPQTTSELTQLNARRVRLCLDDFGTGYSSLTHLHRLPIDQLKIDRSFTSRIHENERDERLVSGIVTLGLRLGLEVVAEGVEMGRQAQMLRRMGCKFGQGHHFAPPQPPEACTLLLARQASRSGLDDSALFAAARAPHPTAG